MTQLFLSVMMVTLFIFNADVVAQNGPLHSCTLDFKLDRFKINDVKVPNDKVDATHESVIKGCPLAMVIALDIPGQIFHLDVAEDNACSYTRRTVQLLNRQSGLTENSEWLAPAIKGKMAVFGDLPSVKCLIN